MSQADGSTIRGEVSTRMLSPTEAKSAGKVLAASHHDYPAFRLLFPDPRRRSRLLELFMSATSRDAAQHALVMAAGDEVGLLGVAQWMPPGASRLSGRRMLQMVPALMRMAFIAPAAMPTFSRVGSTLERSIPAERAWYLQVLGVHPRAQRSGVGKQLMRPVLDRIDGEGLACHLHTSDPNNVAYYRRFGFEVVPPKIRVGDDGPSYIAMCRPAAAQVGRTAVDG